MTSIRVAERRRTIPAQSGEWDTGINGTGRTKPIIPKKDDSNNTNNIVKPANTSNYVEKVLETRANLSAEEQIAFMNITSDEILEISRNFNMSNNSLSLNKNILDSTIVTNIVNPITIIYSRNSNSDFSNNFAKSPSDNMQIKGDNGNGSVILSGNVGAFSSGGSQTGSGGSAAASGNGDSSSGGQISLGKAEVGVLVPEIVNKQNPLLPHKIISFLPTSAKIGTKIVVQHENCEQKIDIGGRKTYLESQTIFTFSINTQKPIAHGTGKLNAKLVTSTPHGFIPNQEIVISGVTPDNYNGTWITQSGTTGLSLTIDYSSKPSNVGTKPPEITVGGSVSGAKLLNAPASFSTKTETAKKEFTITIPTNVVVGQTYRIRLDLNSVPAKSSNVLTILPT